MTRKELLEKYDFRDSTIDEVDSYAGTVTLDIWFPLWKQESYKEGDPENGLLRLTMKDARITEMPDILYFEDYHVVKVSDENGGIIFRLREDDMGIRERLDISTDDIEAEIISYKCPWSLFD